MIELTIIIITLIQKLTCQIIFLNVTSMSQNYVYTYDDFIPQGFNLNKDDVFLFSLSSLYKNENQSIMELCTDKIKDNCVIDHNAIDFQLSVQNVRIINQANISNPQKTLYNAIPFTSDFYLEIRSNNTHNLIVQITKYHNCPNDCKNGGRCEQGICICPKNYLSHDCSIMAQSIFETQTLLNTQFYTFDIYQWMENDEKITQYYFVTLAEEAQIIMECYAQNPYLLQNTTEIQLQIINITVHQINSCLNYVDELESYSKQQFAQIIIKLKQPYMVQFVDYENQVDPLIIGIVVGSITLFILIVIIFFIYRCKKDEEELKRKNEQKQKMENDKKLQEEKENQMMPEYLFNEILEKYPGLKNEQECEICLNLFKTQEKVKLTYCTHIFHSDCLNQWLNKHKTCPMCRENLNFNQLTLNHDQISSYQQIQPHISENQQVQHSLLRPKSQHNTRLYGDQHQNIIEQIYQQVNLPQNQVDNQNKQNQITE